MSVKMPDDLDFADVWEAFTRLRTASSVLYQSACECAKRHHGADHADVLPGWLRDCRDDINAANDLIYPLFPHKNVEGSK